MLPKGDGCRLDVEFFDGQKRAVEAERAETGEGGASDDRAGKQLLSALELLQQTNEKAGRGERLRGMAEMSGLMQRENAALSERVTRF
ncbi:MbeD/MobD family mobilization/exclusion protein [Klebsiella pneumoniae]|uniref:MbeD/MobD family mobilization/exclusion protein n=1 Tax=Klebsiella pneumoniae TaxID=573 RepID=UPI003B28B3A4